MIFINLYPIVSEVGENFCGTAMSLLQGLLYPIFLSCFMQPFWLHFGKNWVKNNGLQILYQRGR